MDSDRIQAALSFIDAHHLFARDWTNCDLELDLHRQADGLPLSQANRLRRLANDVLELRRHAAQTPSN